MPIDGDTRSARDLLKALARYREPDHGRSILELAVTAIPFVVLCVAAWWVMPISYWLTLVFIVPAAIFLVRLFMIQHDCGHGAFFRHRAANDWVGRILGVLTFTPYDVWRRSHATHHATSGNLDKRGVGDVDTHTVREYQSMPRWRRIAYRLHRHPLILFGIGPVYYFLLRNRLPVGISNGDRRFWMSAMGTNLTIFTVAAILIYLLGPWPFLLVQLPVIILASSIGVWLFYVQHQFETTYWESDADWNVHDAALHGSSHYRLPGILGWLTAHIGVHHVHHLSSRIPYYRLPQVLREIPEFEPIGRITLLQSLGCVRLHLWDEDQHRLISFAEAATR